MLTGLRSRLEVVGAGVLRIKSVRLSDAGVYVCTWNTTTPDDTTTSANDSHSAYVNLTVTGMSSNLLVFMCL